MSPRLGPVAETIGQVIIGYNDNANGEIVLSPENPQVLENQTEPFLFVTRHGGMFGEVGYFLCPPTLKKWGAYWFRLVHQCVGACLCPSVQKKIQARVLKFHIWIPRQKIAYPFFFSCLNYLPLQSYSPFKG